MQFRYWGANNCGYKCNLLTYTERPHRPGGCRGYSGTAHEGKGCDQSIGSIVSDAIVRSWLWSTATRSSPLGYFSRLLKVVDNCPHILR